MAQEAKSFKLDLLALSDIRIRGAKEMKIGDYKTYLSGVKEGRAKHGVGVLVHRLLDQAVIEKEEVNERLMWIRLQTKNGIVRVIITYAPCEGSEDESIDFYEDLENLLLKAKNDKLVLMGDLNARVGNKNFGIEKVMGRFGENMAANRNGRRLIDLCSSYGLVITNTIFKHKNIHKYTWREVTRDRMSLIDYVIVSADIKTAVLDTRVFRGFEIGSDHYLLCSRIRIQKQKSHRVKVVCKKVKIENLKNKEASNEYRELINKAYTIVCKTKEGKVEDEWNNYKQSILKTAKEVLGEIVCKDNQKRTSWWNSTVKNAIKEKKRAYKRFLQSKSKDDYDIYKEKRNIANKAKKEAKKAAWEQFGKNVEKRGQEMSKTFWGIIKRLKNGKKREMGSIKDKTGNVILDRGKILDRWSEYFDNLLNVDVVEQDISGEEVEIENSSCEEITFQEVQTAVQKLKAGKAAGIDEIRPEMIKESGIAGMLWLYRIISIAWKSGKVPEEWQKAVIAPIYKKGDNKDCNNYRGISLLSVPGKIYSSILERKIRDVVESKLSDNQCGFRPMRGCQDQIFSLRQISEKCYEKSKPLYMCFIDLEKAYDRVPRDKLFEVLNRYGVQGQLLGAVESLYHYSQAAVRIDGKLSKWFSVQSGVRQGCKLSPLLFIVYMDAIMKNSPLKGEVQLGNATIGSLLYADDLVLISNSKEHLQTNITEVNRMCKVYGMSINKTKSKVMAVGKKKVKLSLKIDDDILEQVSSFTYLGCIFSEEGKIDQDIEYRKSKTASVGAQLRNAIFNKKEISAKTKLIVHKAMVRPVMMYGSESWTDTASNLNKLEVADMRIVRLIAGINRYEQWQENISNEDIRHKIGINSISEVAREARLRWLGHVERMSEDRIPKKLYGAILEGKRKRGRPRRRWEDAIKSDLKIRNINIDMVPELACNRTEWRKLVMAECRKADSAN